MTPEVSILIPIYNVEKYISQCLNSLITDPMINKCEIIICNDCTPDNSMQIIKEIVEANPTLTFKILEHKENKRIAITRQDLLNAATGKYIIFVDSDDWVEPEYITTLYNAAENNNADITTCNLIKNYSNTKIIKQHNLDSETDKNIRNLITTKLPGYLHCKLLKRSVIAENNITFDNELIISEDMLFTLKLMFFTNNYHNTNKALYNYRIISDHSDFSEANAVERIKCNQKIEEVLIKNNNFDLYKRELALRKIFTLIKAFSNAPYKICHNYYQYFLKQSKLIKITSLKNFVYRLLAFSLDTKQICLTDFLLSFFKMKESINNKKLKKI